MPMDELREWTEKKLTERWGRAPTQEEMARVNEFLDMITAPAEDKDDSVADG